MFSFEWISEIFYPYGITTAQREGKGKWYDDETTYISFLFSFNSFDSFAISTSSLSKIHVKVEGYTSTRIHLRK